MSSSELEDGELPSDEDQGEVAAAPGVNGQSAAARAASLMPHPGRQMPAAAAVTARHGSGSMAQPPRVDVYRSSGQYEDSDSGEESDSDDEAELWQRKRAKFQQRMQTGATEFVNPLLVQSQSGAFPPRNSISESSDCKRRVNNVWSSVLTEQTIVGALGSTLSDTSYKGSLEFEGDRDVESYDFTKKYEDDRESLPSDDDGREGELFTEVVELPEPGEQVLVSRKRKHGDRSRRPKKSHRREKSHSHHASECTSDSVTARDSVRTVARHLQSELDEPKYFLLERIVRVVGRATALKFLSMTKTVEDAGGMLIKSGKRRRSPGGVYLQLLRDSKDFSQQQLDEIFNEEDHKFQRKIALKARRRLQKLQSKKGEEAMDQAGGKGGPPVASGDSDNCVSTHTSDRTDSGQDGDSLSETDVVDVPLS